MNASASSSTSHLTMPTPPIDHPVTEIEERTVNAKKKIDVILDNYENAEALIKAFPHIFNKLATKTI